MAKKKMKSFTVTISSHTWTTYKHVLAPSYEELLESLEEDGDESIYLEGVYGKDDGDGGNIDIDEEKEPEPTHRPVRSIPLQSRIADNVPRRELLKNAAYEYEVEE